MICPTVPVRVINTVLNIYLRNGTREFDMILNISRKFSSVGLFGTSRGGNTHSSSCGLKALAIISAVGNAITQANINKTTNSRAVPDFERLTRLPRFKARNPLTLYPPNFLISL